MENIAAGGLLLPAAGDTRSEQTNVLLVGEDAGMVQLQKLCCALGYDAALTSDFQEGLRLLGRRWPALLFINAEVDVSLALVTARIRQHWPGVAVGVLTWWWSEQEDEARQVADYVVHKPLRHAEVETLLREAVSGIAPNPAADSGATARI